MGKYAPALLLAAAIVVALMTSVATYRWLQGKREVGDTKQVETEAVVVALANIAPGSVLSQEQLEKKPFMRGSLPAGSYFGDPAEAQGKVVLSPIKAGEPVLRSRLAPESLAQGGVPAIIKPDKRAMTVRVDKVTGVSGFVKPGNRVDVLLTVSHPETQKRFTRIVLENMLVLASGTMMEQPDKNQPPVQVDVITMEVTPEEAERLALASSEGRIQLALRGYTDEKDIYTKGVSLPIVLAGHGVQEGEMVAVEKAPAPAAPRPAAPKKVAYQPPSRAYKVWVINGRKLDVSKASGGNN